MNFFSIFSELLRQRKSAGSSSKRRYRGLRQIQVAIVVFAFLRSLQKLRPKSAQKRRHHSRKLDGSVRCRRSGTSFA